MSQTNVLAASRIVDPGIPTLSRALNSTELRKQLNEVLPPEWGRVARLETKILRHHPANRCAFNIELETTTGKQELIGKVYAKDCSNIYRTMKTLCQSGFGPTDQFSIPLPVASIPSLKLLLQQKVLGETPTSILTHGDRREQAMVIERCAHWLAYFHTHAKPFGRVFIPTGELIKRWQRKSMRRASPLTEKVDLLANGLQMALAKLDFSERCSCHGDFSHRQVLLSGGRTVVFDWDSYCVAHPARDVAKFTLKLQQLAMKFGSREALNASITHFQRSYAGACRFNVTEQLPFYKAMHCLKHAKLDNEHQKKTEALLDEGLRIIAQEM